MPDANEGPYTVKPWREMGLAMWEVADLAGAWIQRFDDKEDAEFLAGFLNSAYAAGHAAGKAEGDDTIDRLWGLAAAIRVQGLSYEDSADRLEAALAAHKKGEGDA